MRKLKKMLAMGSKPNSSTFPELPDMVVLMRMGLGLAYGISLGLRDSNAGVGIMFGLNLVTIVPIVYLSQYLDADTDSYKSINFAGIPNALALMILVWLYFFTLAHEDEENALRSAVTQVVESVVEADEGSVEDAGEAQPVTDETEF
uniref:Uncharacterized protein n=1 Tax=Pseudictyota dubia TaxID=2749911 RepID=A0A7R9W4I5_9STRA|mmetsp:Transcript_33306/g.61371  ORF Transcript_33306/g.61371 Transcript_33306/m.61371 type:complete len:147 (+) Transcript_33306:165-605(+)